MKSKTVNRNHQSTWLWLFEKCPLEICNVCTSCHIHLLSYWATCGGKYKLNSVWWHQVNICFLLRSWYHVFSTNNWPCFFRQFKWWARMSELEVEVGVGVGLFEARPTTFLTQWRAWGTLPLWYLTFRLLPNIIAVFSVPKLAILWYVCKFSSSLSLFNKLCTQWSVQLRRSLCTSQLFI